MAWLMADALLEAKDARIDVDGAPAIDALTLATTGDQVLVLGAARALFEAASGMRKVAHGELRVLGEAAEASLRSGAVAGAPLDPPLPPRWTPRDYVTWSARLVGFARKDAAASAGEAIEKLSMGASADAPLARAPLLLRRATVVAAALATGARAIMLDDPLVGLPDEQARTLARLVTHALEERAWAVFAGRMPLTSPFAMHADEALVLAGGHVAGQGAPAELAARERAYALRVQGETAAFARRALERGARVGGTSSRMTVELGELSTRDLLAIALESNAVVLELVPLAGAFA